MTDSSEKIEKMRVYQRRDLEEIPQVKKLSLAQRQSMKAVSAALPFRVNKYVCDELIDWDAIPDDPIFQLVFPQEGMLEPGDFRQIMDLVVAGADDQSVLKSAREIQMRLNPHPAGQMNLNVPKMDGFKVNGMQHKYRETVLFFPTAGQTCFAYCSYCFRWAQFVGIKELQFANSEADDLVNYLIEHTEVRNVLITGGDPMVMRSQLLRRYIEPILKNPRLDHVNSIRIGTKALAFHPGRFVSDDDADDLLRLFEEVRDSGRNLAIMAHVSHPRELETRTAREAIRRLQDAGAIIRCQAPLIRHVNDHAETWSRMWRLQVQLGMVPYYMFVERDTGARNYFEVPLYRCLEIFNEAYSQVAGLARTVRGPSMSCTPGKVMIDAVSELAGQKVFILKLLQARDPAWVNRVFFAEYDERATWMDDLKPAFGEREFFFEPALREMNENEFAQVWLNKKEPTLPFIAEPEALAEPVFETEVPLNPDPI